MGRLEQLQLYKRIMRLHQRKLVDLHRQMGDRYVRQEFRTVGAKTELTAEQEKEFLSQWHEYAGHLETEADLFGIGRDLADSVIEEMSDEQRQQLEKLHDSAAEAGKSSRE